MAELPAGLELLERGWMHGNVIAVRGEVPALIDSGYETGAEETLAFARGALGKDPVRLVLAHVHADHAGGVAHLIEAVGMPVYGHRAAADIVDPWNPDRLWLTHTGQSMTPFCIDQVLGGHVHMGDHDWRVVETQGHATGGVSLYERGSRVLVTGDALWQRGFGVLDPWTDGSGVFDATEQALDAIAALDVALVVPGHGPPFTDVAGAMAEARGRLAHLRSHPERLQAQMVRNLAGFLRLARPEVTVAELRAMVLGLAAVVDMSPEQAVAELSKLLGPDGPPRDP